MKAAGQVLLRRQRQERPLILAGLVCCAALLLGLGGVVPSGSAGWLRNGAGFAGLLLGLVGGLLAAHLLLDERSEASQRTK